MFGQRRQSHLGYNVNWQTVVVTNISDVGTTSHLREFLPFQKILYDLELLSYSASVFFFVLSLACKKKKKNNNNTQQMSTTRNHRSITIYYPKLIIFLNHPRVWCYNLHIPPLLTHFWESWDKTMGAQSQDCKFSPHSVLCGVIYTVCGHRLK